MTNFYCAVAEPVYYERMIKTLNLTQLAKYTGINKRTLHRMIADGRFPVSPIVKTSPRLWSVEQIEAWLRGES